MASEIRVNKIENRSGLGTVTFADTGVDLAGIVTATTFSGSGASLTALPSAQLSGALPAISAASLTNVPAANVVGVHTSLTVTNATTTGTAVVGGGVTISESGIEASGIGITCANINGGQISGRRNLIINGDMRIAQRGGTSTTTSEFVVDRFRHAFSMGGGVTITYSQGTLSTSDSPYSEGHRHYIREALSGSTSDASSYYIQMAETRLEAQDIAQSGWNYTDPNSKLTLSFWARASVAMTYGFVLQSADGTAKLYPKSFALSANTWTKIKHTIPGHADLQFDNDANIGFTMKIYPYLGSGYCGGTDGAWADQSAGKYGSDNTGVTWLNGANTFDVTGVQLEVGSQATAFEHRSFGEELALCERYCLTICKGQQYFGTCMLYNSLTHTTAMVWKTEMRTSPTMVANSGTNYYITYRNSGNSQYDSLSGTSTVSATGGGIYTANGSGTAGHAGAMAGQNSNTLVLLTAEL